MRQLLCELYKLVLGHLAKVVERLGHPEPVIEFNLFRDHSRVEERPVLGECVGLC